MAVKKAAAAAAAAPPKRQSGKRKRGLARPPAGSWAVNHAEDQPSWEEPDQGEDKTKRHHCNHCNRRHSGPCAWDASIPFFNTPEAKNIRDSADGRRAATPAQPQASSKGGAGKGKGKVKGGKGSPRPWVPAGQRTWGSGQQAASAAGASGQSGGQAAGSAGAAANWR